MTTRELSIAALSALAAAGGVYALDKSGNNERVAIVSDITGKVEVKGADATALLAAAAEAGAMPEAPIRCQAGGNLDGVWRDDKEWCSDGNGATWVRDANGDETVEIVGGKVWSTKAAGTRTAIEAVK